MKMSGHGQSTHPSTSVYVLCSTLPASKCATNLTVLPASIVRTREVGSRGMYKALTLLYPPRIGSVGMSSAHGSTGGFKATHGTGDKHANVKSNGKRVNKRVPRNDDPREGPRNASTFNPEGVVQTGAPRRHRRRDIAQPAGPGRGRDSGRGEVGAAGKHLR